MAERTETSELLRLEGLYKQRRFSTALTVAEGIMIDFPDSFQISILYIKILKELKQLKKAKDFTTQLMRRFPYNISLLLEMGSILQALQKYDEALEYYNKILFLDPFNTEASGAIEKISKKDKSTEEPKKDFREFIGKSSFEDEIMEQQEEELELPPHNLALEFHKNKIKLHPEEESKNLLGEDEKQLEPSRKRDKIFISYSHSDEYWLKEVQKHFKTLEHDDNKINVWVDTRIKAGMKWKEEIEKALSETKIAVLLISTDFLVSDFIRNNELPPLLEAAENEGAIILPLILKPSRFINHAKLSQFQAVNDPDKPLNKLSEAEQDEILVKLTNRIEELIKGK